MTPGRVVTPLAWLLAGVVAGCPPAAGQTERPLGGAPESSGVTVEELDSGLRTELEELLARADLLFASPRQADSVALYGEAIRWFEGRGPEALNDPGARRLLAHALARRAEARFNLGDTATAKQDLRNLLVVVPGYRFDPDQTSPKLAELLQGLARDLVTEVTLGLDPPDTLVSVDGRPAEVVDGRLTLMVGERRLALTRPGYLPQEKVLALRAGRRARLAVELERASAVLAVVTRPVGVEVRLDGRQVGLTAAPEPGEPSPPVPSPFAGDGASAPLALDGVAPGTHLLELRRDGMRSRRLRLTVDALRDFVLPPLALEPTRGTLVLAPLPPSVVLRLDGEPRHPGPRGLVIELAPGEHLLEVVDGTAGYYRAPFTLHDQQRLELAPRLRPALSLLGVVGGDEIAACDAQAALLAAAGSLGSLLVVDRRDEGRAVLAAADLDVAGLARWAQAPWSGPKPDWGRLQREADRRAPAALYLLAQLLPDPARREADLWLFSPAPGPARPVRWRLPVDDGRALARALAALDAPLSLERPWLGADVADSDLDGGPVVVAVAAAGPAAAAGLLPGDTLVSLAGGAVASAAALLHRLGELPAGTLAACTVRRRGALLTVELDVRRGPFAAAPRQLGLAYPVAWARLAESTPPTSLAPGWLRDLDRALVLLEAGSLAPAIDLLRGIQAPAGAGLGQAAVDYWLGVALATAGRSAPAIEALGRAARQPEARLQQADGPLVAPRALARRAWLEAPR